MRKEFVYSLLAAAAVPGVANADAVQKDAVDINQWTGTDVSLNSGKTLLYSNSGETISYSLGKWAKGSYKLDIASIKTDESALKVSVGGETVDVAAKGTAASVEFTLDAETELTITIESVNKKYFEIGQTKLTLVFDFAAAKAKFQAPLTKVTNTINGYTNTNKAKYVAQAGTIQSEINRLKDDATDGTDAYKAYIEYNLSEEITDEHPLMKQIASLLNDAAYAEKQYLIEQVEANEFAKLKTAYEAVTDAAAKEYLKADYEAIQALIQEYRTGAKSKYDEGKADEFDGDGNDLKAIKDAITALSGKIGTDVKANADAYTAVKTAAEAAKGSYLSDLVTNLKDAEKQVFSYENLLTIGRQVISDKIAKLQQILDENEASYKAGTAAADKVDSKDKDGNTVKGYDSRITDLNAELAAAYTKYAETLKGKLDGFETAYATELAKQTKAETDYKDVIADHATEYQALEDAVAAVKAAIDAANSGDCEALATLDLTAKVTAVDAAVKALDAVCADAQAKVTAVAQADEKLAELDETWTKAKEAIAKLKYGENAVANYFDEIPAGIDEAIAAEKALAKKNNEDSKVKGDDTFYKKTLDTDIAAIKAKITKYQADAEAAAKQFNAVSEKLEKARKALAEAKAKVENLDIYTAETTVSGTKYKTDVEAAEADIKAADEAIAAALKLKDDKNVAAVKALTYDDTNANKIVAAINANYEADQKAWQATADATAIAAQKQAAKDLQSSLDTDKDNIQKDIENLAKPLGNATAEIQTKLNAIEIPTAAEVAAIVDADPLDTAKLTEILSKLNQAQTDMDKVKALAEEAKTRVADNNTAKTTADATVTALNWTIEQDNIKTAAGDAYTANLNKEQTEVEALIKDIDDAINAAKAAITESYGAETLKEDFEATIKAQLTTIASDIKAAKTTADNLLKNYNAYQTIVTNAGAVNIATAQTAATTADPVAGKAYYSDKLLAVTYAEVLKKIQDDNKAQYEAKSSVASQKALQARIDDLNNKIAAVEQDAKDNLASYIKVQKDETAVTKVWNDKSVELASGNESSKLKEYQAKLDELLTKLNDQKAADKTAYDNGQAKANETAAQNALAQIKKDIETLVTEAMEGYDEQIAADNEGMKNAIATEKQKTQAVLQSATETINAYKNLKSEKAKKALADVKTAYDKVNQTLYDVPTDMNDAWAKALAEYEATTSPTVFDKDSTYVNQFRGFATTIEADLTTFLGDVKKALQDAIGGDITGYEKSIADEEATVKGYKLTDDDAKAAVFDELKKKVAAAKTAMTDPDVAKLDAALIDLESFDKELAAATDQAAKLDLEPALLAAEADVEAGKAYLAGDAKTLEAYETTVKNTVEAAREKFDESTDLSKDYAAIEKLITDYNTTNEYKTATSNNAAYEEIMEKIAEQEEVLAEAAAAVQEAGYGCIEILKTQTNGFNDIAKRIDELEETAEGAKEGKTNYKAMKADIDKITTMVNNVIAQDGNLKTTEKAYLDERIKELKAEYTRFAASSTDAEAVAAQKKAIDDLEAAITKDAKDTKKTAKDLLAYEAQVKEALANLVQANDGEAGQEAYRAALNTTLDEVAAKAVIGDEVDESVKADYADDMELLQAQIEAVRAEIEASENPAYDTDRIESEIAAIEKEVDALIKKIEADDDTAKKAIAANEKASEDKVKELEGYEEQIATSKAKLDKYAEPTAQAANFEAKYTLLENKIAEAKAKNEDLAAEGKADATVDAKLKTAIADGIAEIEDAAANRQVNADLKALQAEFAELEAIVVNESNYTPKDLKTINDNKTDIKKRINGTYDKDGKLTKNGLVQDIKADLTTLKSETNLATRQAEIKALLKEIEATETIINDNKLTPDAEPEPEVVPGDITGTGEVTGDDFDQFAQDLVNGNVPAPGDPDFAAYDANGDGQITVADLQAILNLMVGNNADGTPKTAARSKQTAEEESGALSVKATQMGNVTRLAVVLNSTSEFTGFQMDVLAPAGTRVVGESLGENMPEMMLLSSDLATSAHRIVGFASNGTLSNGTVLYIDVEGAGDVKFADVVFTTAKAKSVTMNLGDATGINGIEAEQSNGIFYDLGGKVMKTLKKGINIIRNANGTTKKVVVK